MTVLIYRLNLTTKSLLKLFAYIAFCPLSKPIRTLEKQHKKKLEFIKYQFVYKTFLACYSLEELFAYIAQSSTTGQVAIGSKEDFFYFTI